MRKFIFLSILSILFLSGCDIVQQDVSKMDPKKLPDVPAFQDEFTRGFMGSTDEIEDGFYLFQSQTGKYTMMYPGNAKMQKAFYGFTGENYEKLLYAGGDEEVTGATYTVDLSFKHNKDTIRLDTHLSVVSMGIRYDGDFEKIETDDTEIYFAKNTLPEDGKTIGSYNFFGVVKSKESNKTLNYIYMVYCEERSEDGCGYDTEAIEAHVKKLMKSVTFEPGEREDQT